MSRLESWYIRNLPPPWLVITIEHPFMEPVNTNGCSGFVLGNSTNGTFSIPGAWSPIGT